MCLQMFHRGHAKLLDTLMNAGHKLILGVHDDRSIYLNKGIRTGDPTITRVCNVRRMLRPQDEIFVVVDRDPTDCLKEVVPRLLRDGVDGGGGDYEEISGNFVDLSPRGEGSAAFERIVYMRGDDMPQFPGREYLESQGIEVIFLPYTQGVSATSLRNAWGCTIKVLDDRIAIALLEAHENHVYKPLRKSLERGVKNAASTRNGRAALANVVTPNRVTITSCACTIPYVVAMLLACRQQQSSTHSSSSSSSSAVIASLAYCSLAASLAFVHDMLDRLDGAVAGAYRSLGLPHDGNYGAYLDAMCDKVFGITALVVWVSIVVATLMKSPGMVMTSGVSAGGVFMVLFVALAAVKIPLHLMLATVRTQDYCRYLVSKKSTTTAIATTNGNSDGNGNKKDDDGKKPNVALPAVGEGKLATCSENVACMIAPLAWFFASFRVDGGVLANVLWGITCALMITSVDMAMRSLRHKLRARW